MAAVLPVYYAQVAGANLEGNLATVYWAYTTSISLLVAAVLGPILGAVADFRGEKKKFLAAFMVIGVLGTALLYFVRTGDWLMASAFFVLGELGFAGSLVFYDSLLPHIAGPNEIDQVSSRGYAMGYLGGGLLLAVNLVMIMFAPEEITGLMTRLTFVTVAVWWFVFSIPVLRLVPEPPNRVLAGEAGVNPVKVSFQRLGRTFSEIRRYRELFIFLVAFWFYNDGIGTIIKMATIYGAEIGITQTTLIGTLLMVQFVGIRHLPEPAHLYRDLHRRLLYEPGMALLGAGLLSCHRTGRQPGAFARLIWPAGPQEQVGGVLRLLLGQRKVRRDRGAIYLRPGRADDGQFAAGDRLAGDLLHHRRNATVAGEC
jgi:MFS-type transporter involved in bile tolerance (Atg22 family)